MTLGYDAGQGADHEVETLLERVDRPVEQHDLHRDPRVLRVELAEDRAEEQRRERRGPFDAHVSFDTALVAEAAPMISSSSATSRWYCGSSRSPAEVSASARVERTKSCAPISSSRRVMRLVTTEAPRRARALRRKNCRCAPRGGTP